MKVRGHKLIVWTVYDKVGVYNYKKVGFGGSWGWGYNTG